MRSLRGTSVILVMLFGFLLTGAPAIGGKPPDPYAGWLTYRNKQYGIEFRYPPNLKIRVLDPHTGGIPTLRLDLLLVDKAGGPYAFVVNLLVNEAMADPMTSVPTKPFLKKVCKQYQERRYNGYEVIHCVTCGRAACAWEFYHLGKYVYDWMCCYNKTGFDEEPDNSKYPILKIIKSARYGGRRDGTQKMPGAPVKRK